MEDQSAKVRKIIAEALGLGDSDITDDTQIIDDLEADSLDTVEIVLDLENAFGFEISEEEAEAIGTVGDAIALINRRTSTQH